jgi:hypothetical protein
VVGDASRSPATGTDGHAATAAFRREIRCEAFKGCRLGAVNVEGTNGDQVNRRNEGEARKARRAAEHALQQMSAVDAPGFIAAEHYRNVEDEDTVIGIYDWKSNEERVASSQSLDPGTREQLLEVLATPMRIVLADHIE